MTYYEVMVASSSYHGQSALTYSSEAVIPPGAIVSIPLRNTHQLGIIVRAVQRPGFNAKPIQEVIDLPCLPQQSLDLLSWIQLYYPSSAGITTQQFLPKQIPKKPVEAHCIVQPKLPKLPSLTADQKTALASVEEKGMHILHGETGTGKTRVYIEMAQQALKQGKSALILTPEIGLTSQLSQDFRVVFGNNVLVMHSQLTEVTRQRQWVTILKHEKPIIIIGARSALFAPLKNIGLIVIDEAHEPAYKQDQSPHYHATRVAAKLAELHNCPIILGSATPLISDYYLAEHLQRPIIRMKLTANSSGDPATQSTTTTVIDLKDRSKFTKKSHLSDTLITAISDALQNKEQSLLFLNRRGTARVVFCEQCGWQALCPHCDTPLVYHGDAHTMRCHSCDYKAATPTSCVECHNASIVFKSIGTKAIVDEVQRLFPEARIQRFDTDNRKADRVEQHYESLRTGEIDILIGTQTLAKGLDLPKLSVVGVIIADTSLYFPDFSAQERTYQLLAQVLGRVGRGHRRGRAILQTYNPDSPLLQSILTKDWRTFYDNEIRERSTFLFPPFCYLLKLTCRRASSASAERTAANLVKELRISGLRILVEGPAPAFHEKVLNKYQWQITVKAKDRKQLVEVIHRLPSGWSYDIDPMNLL